MRENFKGRASISSIGLIHLIDVENEESLIRRLAQLYKDYNLIDDGKELEAYLATIRAGFKTDPSQ